MADWTRRQFVAAGGGVIAGIGLGGVYTAAGRPARGEPLLRPPGALPEDGFLAACIRCGQCVQACPYDVLHLADLDEGVEAGTPYFIASENPCNLCRNHDSLRCIDACPTAALSPIEFEDIDIGEAHICKGKCLAYNGTICRACWHACPFPDDALYFDDLLRVHVDTDHCIGCGLCEHACPTDPKAVTITPREAFARREAGGRSGGRRGGQGRGAGAGRGGDGRGEP